MKELTLKLLNQTITEENNVFSQDEEDNVSLLTNESTIEQAVKAFQELAWDLESFTEFILNHEEIPNEERVELLGQATLHHREWDT